MRAPQDDRFRTQQSLLVLRFTCDHCAMFDPERQRCVHGYPTDEHRLARYEADREAPVVFCKEWDLA